MRGEAQRALGFFLVVLALGVSAVVLLPRWLNLATGPENEVLAALKATEPKGLRLEVPGFSRPLISTRHQYQRLTTTVDAGLARVVGTLDFVGAIDQGATVQGASAIEVSSLGLERVVFARDGWTWRPRDGWAPRLAAIVALLERRRRALETGDLETLRRLARSPRAPDGSEPTELKELTELLTIQRRRYHVERWLIRSERNEVLVTEEYRLTGDLPDRPVDARGTRRLTLVPHGEEEFFFSAGLM